MKKLHKGFVTIPLLIIILAGLVVSIYILRANNKNAPSKNTQNTNSEPPSPLLTNANTEFIEKPESYYEIPPLPQTINWVESKNYNYKNAFVVDEINGKRFDYFDTVGTLWTHKGTNLNKPELSNLFSDFRNSYTSHIAKKQWPLQIKRDGYRIDAHAATGIGGETTGYILERSDSIQVVLYGYRQGPFNPNGPPPPELNCPCIFDIEVFVSDLVPLSDLLPKE